MFKLIVIAISFSLVFISCSDDSVSSDESNSVSCKINGSDWKSIGTEFGIELGTHRKQLRVLGFKETDTVELIIKFFAIDSMEPGTYELSNKEEYYAVYRHEGSLDTARSGSITLDYINEEDFPVEARGSFNFEVKAYDSQIYNFTNGKFDSGNID